MAQPRSAKKWFADSSQHMIQKNPKQNRITVAKVYRHIKTLNG